MPETAPDTPAFPPLTIAKACPDCRGKGHRIITDDGTRPACLTCRGAGIVPDARGVNNNPEREES